MDLKHIEEGLSVQLMHIGPYSEEPVSLKKMEEFMLQQGLRMNGRHHEIYLSDFRKTAPEIDVNQAPVSLEVNFSY